MKVKWTTITDDEATWPRGDKFVLFIHLEPMSFKIMGKGAYKCLDVNRIYTINLLMGCQWRPMPKPPKRKKSPWKSNFNELPNGNLERFVFMRNVSANPYDIPRCEKAKEAHYYSQNGITFEWMEVPE